MQRCGAQEVSEAFSNNEEITLILALKGFKRPRSVTSNRYCKK